MRQYTTKIRTLGFHPVPGYLGQFLSHDDGIFVILREEGITAGFFLAKDVNPHCLDAIAGLQYFNDFRKEVVVGTDVSDTVLRARTAARNVTIDYRLRPGEHNRHSI